MEINLREIGKRIRQKRRKLALSREELAELVGLSDYYIGQIERGERQMSLSVMAKIADCLHMDLNYLIFGKCSNKYYEKYEVNDDIEEINQILKECKPSEIKVIEKLIKIIIPYMRNEI